EWETGRWRAVFVLYGSLGFVWAAAFWWLYRDRPRLHPWCNAAEADLIGEGTQRVEPVAREPLPVAAILRSPEIWLLCAFNCAVNVGWIFLVTWLTPYLVETYGEYLTAHVGDR